jgi:hypothetical protein
VKEWAWIAGCAAVLVAVILADVFAPVTREEMEARALREANRQQ